MLQRFTNSTAKAGSVAIVGGIGRLTPRSLPLSLDTGQARLTRQAGDAVAPVAIPPGDWDFAGCRADHTCPRIVETFGSAEF